MHVSKEPGTLAVYATDNSIYQVTPSGVAVPASVDDVVELVATNRSSTSPRPLVARGAGTGTNGQSLTNGVTLDFKRSMHRVLEVDVEGRTARVEPGVVADALNEHLAPFGLFWPPHTSTSNRCTVGGMISTDAAGQGSLLYGRTSRHVIALDVVLDDGTLWHACPVSLAEAERLAAGTGRVAEIWRALLAVPDEDFGLPELARGFSGYGVDRVRRGDLIDPLPVLVGSEGTLAITVGATLGLTPIPASDIMVLAGYPTFDDALEDSLRLRSTGPSSIETIDEHTMRQGRSSTAWPLLEEVIGDEAGSILMIEYTSNENGELPDVAEVDAIIRSGGRATSARIVTEHAVKTAARKVRADAVGLLAKVKAGESRPTAFVEDCAVPVVEMPAFVSGFRAILDRRGLRYGMFGHADVGCVHVRPALDPLGADHDRQVKEITEEVVALLARHGGILWGEHGRGFRGQFASDFLTPSTLQIMRTLKTAFDPLDLFNPGKLYRPLGATEPLLAIDAVPTRAAADRRVSGSARAEFTSAFSCNGNGLCHNYATNDVMCPSYKVTRDPKQSPKGRADLLRAWLLAEEDDGGASADLTEEVATSLSQCLSCAACTGRCPVQVDIPELKSRFFERYYATRRRPVAHRLMSRFEQFADVASVAGPLARLGSRVLAPRLGLTDLPTPPARRKAAVPLFEPGGPHDGSGDRIVVLTDVFTRTFEPQTLACTVEILTAVDYDVSAAPFTPSAKFDHVKGNRRAFAKAAAAQAHLVQAVLDTGATPTVIDPAVALMFGREYPEIHPGFPAGVRGLAEVLAERADRLSPIAKPQTVTLFGHCTERSLAPAWLGAWRRTLEAVGHEVVVVESTCCGMAGVFGHEIANQAVSAALFDQGWRPTLDHAAGPVAATGWSCRSQAERFGFAGMVHPVHLL